jgi:hypothetical protein
VTHPAILAHRRVHLPLATLARLLVMTMLSEISEDSRLLAFLFEPFEGPLEILVVVNDYF